ncbi:MAG: hypothetical protein JRI23_18945 [Deltaproteobacteria bacterium]|nr:hypothetical protein [Deltaproteobacteria bacterium]MBW2533942.1 hypothetical protein [Deltaproteobacteria bacterium]
MDRCVACGFRSAGRLVPLALDGYVYCFCEHHARQLGPDLPTTTPELAKRLAMVALERRTGSNRRQRRHEPALLPHEQRTQPRGRRAED